MTAESATAPRAARAPRRGHRAGAKPALRRGPHSRRRSPRNKSRAAGWQDAEQRDALGTARRDEGEGLAKGCSAGSLPGVVAKLHGDAACELEPPRVGNQPERCEPGKPKCGPLSARRHIDKAHAEADDRLSWSVDEPSAAKAGESAEAKAAKRVAQQRARAARRETERKAKVEERKKLQAEAARLRKQAARLASEEQRVKREQALRHRAAAPGAGAATAAPAGAATLTTKAPSTSKAAAVARATPAAQRQCTRSSPPGQQATSSSGQRRQRHRPRRTGREQHLGPSEVNDHWKNNWSLLEDGLTAVDLGVPVFAADSAGSIPRASPPVSPGDSAAPWESLSGTFSLAHARRVALALHTLPKGNRVPRLCGILGRVDRTEAPAALFQLVAHHKLSRERIDERVRGPGPRTGSWQDLCQLLGMPPSQHLGFALATIGHSTARSRIDLCATIVALYCIVSDGDLDACLRVGFAYSGVGNDGEIGDDALWSIVEGLCASGYLLRDSEDTPWPPTVPLPPPMADLRPPPLRLDALRPEVIAPPPRSAGSPEAPRVKQPGQHQERRRPRRAGRPHKPAPEETSGKLLQREDAAEAKGEDEHQLEPTRGEMPQCSELHGLYEQLSSQLSSLEQLDLSVLQQYVSSLPDAELATLAHAPEEEGTGSHADGSGESNLVAESLLDETGRQAFAAEMSRVRDESTGAPAQAVSQAKASALQDEEQPAIPPQEEETEISRCSSQVARDMSALAHSMSGGLGATAQLWTDEMEREYQAMFARPATPTKAPGLEHRAPRPRKTLWRAATPEKA